MLGLGLHLTNKNNSSIITYFVYIYREINYIHINWKIYMLLKNKLFLHFLLEYSKRFRFVSVSNHSPSWLFTQKK